MIGRLDDELDLQRVRQFVAETEPVPDYLCRSMAQVATQGVGQGQRRWGRRRFVAALSVAVIAGGSVAAAAAVDRLVMTRQDTGVYERRPARTPHTWTAAQTPYLSVQPLMQYLGADVPVVPTAAIVTRGGKRVVFALVAVPNELPEQHGRARVAAVPVTVSNSIGKASVITSGLTPCAEVVAEPPPALQSGDSIETYVGGSEESVHIDFNVLFGGRAPAPPPRIEGGISHGAGPSRVAVSVVDQQANPGSALYKYTAPDGATQRIRYARSVEFTVQTVHLRQGQRIGTMEVLSNGGQVIAKGSLDWYC